METDFGVKVIDDFTIFLLRRQIVYCFVIQYSSHYKNKPLVYA